MLRTSDLDYTLPSDRIATEPASPRDSARLMVVDKASGTVIEHARVRDLPRFLKPADAIIVNTTTVLRAWIDGRKEIVSDTRGVRGGGRVEGLYLGLHAGSNGDPAGHRWRVILKGGHLHPGSRIEITHEEQPMGVWLELIERDAHEPGAWVVGVSGVGAGESVEAVLNRVGGTPIPPYIRRAREIASKARETSDDRSLYQTIYADPSTLHDGAGSVAAPTAGLHFTPSLLAALRERGVERGDVVLHVGTGTFRPVETEFVEQHPMHEELCSLGHALGVVGRTKARGGRVVAVGTTSARTLESYAGHLEGMEPGAAPPAWLSTRLLITPGYRWRWVDAMLTNFHLPRSTLLAMVAALLPGGVPALKGLYDEAIRCDYRFYSYGDAMLIV